MSFPRYPKYKDSGVKWLGEVPEHWSTGRLRYVSELLVDGTHHSPASHIAGDHLYITAKNIKERGFDLSEITYVTADDHREIFSRCPVRKGDVLYIKDGATAGIAMVNPLDEEFSLLSSVALVRPKRTTLLSQFVAYHLNAGQFKSDVLNRLVGGAMTRFTLDLISRFVFTIPSIAEQTAIAAFLDRETAKIDELVAEQRRLIELLKEKRQAVISHAVTKGLNPHAPMKPSGIEWLGVVPEHWRVGKLGYACKLRGGFAFSAADFGADGVVVVRMNNLKRGQLDLTEAARIPESCCNEAVALAAGDLVWGMSGSTGVTGSLGNYARARAEDLPCQLNQRVGRFVVDKSLLTLDFFENVIQTAYFYEQVMLLVTGTAQFNVSSEQVQSCLIALPTIDEQLAIADFLARETAALDALTAEAERGIELLQERRTALISAAVTGKIDVRNFVEAEAA